MSQPPPFNPYAGYVPPAKPPFWTRTKVAVLAGVFGLVVGLLIGVGGAAVTDEPEADEPEAADTSQFSESEVDEVVDEAVDDAVEDAVAEEAARMQEKLDQQRANAQARIDKAKDRLGAASARAISQAVARVRAEERARAARAVAAAEAEANQDVAPVPLAGGGTDPRFNYCYEANDAGYGPYYQGQDPEYDWYDDADGDGTVCE